MIYFTLLTAISKVDSKGRISIPIRLRAKLNLVEGRFVKITFQDNSLILIPNSDVTCVTNVLAKTKGGKMFSEKFFSLYKMFRGQSSVKVSTGVCETSRPGSIPGSGPDVELETALRAYYEEFYSRNQIKYEKVLK